MTTNNDTYRCCFKVTNQLIKICKNHIGDDFTHIWRKLFEEIQSGGIVDDIKENFHLDKRVNHRSNETRRIDVLLCSRTSNVSVTLPKEQRHGKAMAHVKVHFNA
jgi:hypothetical protein